MDRRAKPQTQPTIRWSPSSAARPNGSTCISASTSRSTHRTSRSPLPSRPCTSRTSSTPSRAPSSSCPQPALAGLPVIWYGGVHCDPDATAQLRRVLYQHFPSVTVIDVAATLETVRQVLLQVTYVIQFLAAFSIFAGIVILVSSIASTRYRRIREVVVLKTLGATRPRIATIFSIEFAVLGLIAGAVGLVFANLLGRLLLHRALHFDYNLQLGFSTLAWLSTAALTVAAGWLASHRVLGQKPLEVLREE